LNRRERVRIAGGWGRKLYNEELQSVVRYCSGDQVLGEAIVREQEKFIKYLVRKTELVINTRVLLNGT
jgi:hypothetical protein